MFSLVPLTILLKLTGIAECATCQGNCQNFKFVIDQDVVHDSALEGHVVKRMTVKSAAQCHMECRDECLCASINYLQNTREHNCELNDVNKEMKPAALKYKPGARYYDLVRSYSVEGGRRYMPKKDICINKCCEPDPCFQGGVCREICDPETVRFNCTCPDDYTGQRCEKIKYPRNCKDIWKNGALTSGKYSIYENQNEPFLVYCDLESEPEFFWALIQSFSLENKKQFDTKVFNLDYPVDEYSLEVNWTLHRLSLPHIQHLAGNSTHLRVTCNFHSQGFNYTDYARADLKNHDIFDTWFRECMLYEYLNIRGIECYNCTALTNQNDGDSWFINSYASRKKFDCDFDGRPGNCQNFKFVIDQDVVHDNALEGHVVKRITVNSAAQCHMECRDECLCVSINYLQNTREGNCELNDVNREMKPAALKYKPGARYYDLVRSYSVEGGRRYMPEKDICINKCCEPDPCFQGGVCREICDPETVRFNCTCPDDYTGQRCEKIKYLARNCKDIWKYGTLTSGKMSHFLCTVTLNLNLKFFWALIQSFSFGNKKQFDTKVFNLDYPIDEYSLEVNWTLHRLSLPHIQHLAGNSTHLRVTCNFHSQGFNYTDYARADLKNHDIFDTWRRECMLYEYLNIREIECYNCTALTNQNDGSSWYILNSYTSYTHGCDLDGRPGIGDNEQNFGHYYGRRVNPDHRCSSGPSSTTEHWLGVKRDF
ncbi:Hyaluronan-binding protein 2 [Desmophyllum pertusum]|uniref:Hyaluronan-binding protein 2 n=1 Tax=Desmophyllum pertusum TaxID=174260 RepID=A0A9X0CWN5_9CNID|nr:Hyaluronan-binding protein 2 [Desmophyllum pertusum]